jgi:hypothetical protein
MLKPIGEGVVGGVWVRFACFCLVVCGVCFVLCFLWRKIAYRGGWLLVGGGVCLFGPC